MSDEPRIDHAARLRLMADDLDGLSGDEIRELLHDAADEIDRLTPKEITAEDVCHILNLQEVSRIAQGLLYDSQQKAGAE